MATGSMTQSEVSGSTEDNPDRLKQLYPAVDDDEKPLPRIWSVKEKSDSIGLSRNNLRVHYKGSGKSDKDAASVRANNPIPAACGIYYFEVKIISKGRDGYMGIGLSAQGVTSTNRLPGWDKQTYGYHGDDGNAFCSSGQGQPYGPTFTTGDVVGCCVNLIENTCFYTKNGVSLGNAFNNLPPNLVPTVGLQTPGEIIEANFGQSPFVYDIEDYMKEWRHKIKLTIERFPVSDRKGEFQSALNRMVSTYLVHHGYCSTAEAFSRCTEEPIAENIQSIQDRQRIQKLVLEGRMGEAIEKTETLYPSLLDAKPDLLFALKCRQFVEMVNGTDSEVRNNNNSNIQFGSNSSYRNNTSGNSSRGCNTNNIGGSPSYSTSSSPSLHHQNNSHHQQHTRGSPRGNGGSILHSTNNSTNSGGGGDTSNGKSCSSPSHSPHKPSTSSTHTNTNTSNSQQRSRGGTPPNSSVGSPNRTLSSSSKQHQQHYNQQSNNHHQNGACSRGDDEAALNSVNSNQVHTDHIALNGGSSGQGPARILEAAEDMDLSDGDHSSTLSNGNSHVNGSSISPHCDDDDEEMDVDGSTHRRQMCGGNEEAIEKMLAFGKELKMMSQRLRKDFGRNEENKKALQDAFSLLAYADPWNSPIGSQLLPVKREPVCDALNSAILESKGLPRQPPLEVAIAQARQCMRLMSESGIGSCAFASVLDYLH